MCCLGFFLPKLRSRIRSIARATYLTNTKTGTVYREVYKRRLKKIDQLSFSSLPEYDYDCIATNDTISRESEVYTYYNGRANVENNIRELKNGYALGQIITSDFDANDVSTQITIFGYLLMSHFKRKVLPDKMQRNQLSTLRWSVFNIPGRMVSAARQAYVKIHNLFTDEKIYAEIFFRLKTLQRAI